MTLYLNSINIIHHHWRRRDTLRPWSLIRVSWKVHIWEHFSRDFFILLHLTRKTFELHDIDVVQVVEMRDLHVEADIILLASQPVRAYLLVRHPVKVEGSQHFREHSLGLSRCSAVNVEGPSTHFHPCGWEESSIFYALPSVRCV